MDKKRILLVGESWVSSAIHYKGFDQFGSVTYHTGADALTAALGGSEFELQHLPAHLAPEQLPFTLDALDDYAAVLLSDIGADSMLLHPDVWSRGKTVPNRLKLLRDWTERGGNLAMFGGYMSFQGIDGKGRWHRTPVEQALPVECLPFDDRLEVPEGFTLQVVDSYRNHEIFQGIPRPWPVLLGANEVVVKPGAEVLARLPVEQGGYPLLVTGAFGAGRSLAWMSDISPHWLPQSFSDWPGYRILFLNMLRWLTDANR